VQGLGINLVNEVWSPTKYVADVYSPLIPTYLIGKGLYEAESASAPVPGAAPGRPFRFVTVFDFDSSIERKNPLAVVRAFQKAFRPDENVELVVKGSNVNPDHWSNALGHWERLNEAIAGDARISLITARLSDAEMTGMLRGAGCFVSLHAAEGFGYVIADAMALGIPVIATDYSGNTDFCNAETAFPVSYRLIPVDSRALPWRAPGAEWAAPDIDSAAAQMRAVFDHQDRAREVGARGRAHVLAKYATEVFRTTVLARIREIGRENTAR
jgi:glycosyltransferase involved in cell wall biosynthesis